MSIFSRLSNISHHQVRNLKRLLQGVPVVTPSLGSMTLEFNDVSLAKKLLRDRSGWYDEGIVRSYEKQFARWNGSNYAFAFMGGRVALSACIHALGLKSSDEVILPGYTCVVVPNAFHRLGIKTIYADIELDTYGLEAEDVEKRITKKTRAILIHHLYGLVCRDYEKLISLARRNGLKIIEDCAHSTGAEYMDVKVGNRGDVAFYSSEQSKVFNTIQGGIAIANDQLLAKRIQEFQAECKNPEVVWIEKQLNNVVLNYYQYKHPHRWYLADYAELLYGDNRLVSTAPEEVLGIIPEHYKRKMPSVIAALGKNQLMKIDRFNALRVQNSRKWARWCEIHGYRKPKEIVGSKPIYLRYPVMVEEDKKQNTTWALKSEGVDIGVWFVSHIHPSPVNVAGCPNADKAVKQCINFPTLFL